MKKTTHKDIQLLIGACVVLVAILAYGAWEYRETKSELRARIDTQREELQEKRIENEGLQAQLEKRNQQVSQLAQQVQDITGTVNVLEKLQSTDEELLQKYSKVYFLNEHYAPPQLREIPEEYLSKDDEPEHIHAKVWPYLEDLLGAAEDDGINLRVLSAFRSFEEQSDLKARYRTIYGSGANTFSADQGYSEHQLGTTVDLNIEEMGTSLSNFETTEAYEWLQENAHKYGFTLSYPPNNSYYTFEPWHWRFVGLELATRLYNTNQYFYDMPQREIDEYLVNIFD